MKNLEIKIKMLSWSSVVLRMGLGLVMIWFGSQQIMNPTSWLVFLPTWTNSLPITQMQFIFMNGWFEVVFGGLLVLGIFTRIVALLLTLHMAGIVTTVGYNEIGVRDFGIFTGLLSTFLHGASDFSVDKIIRKS